MMDVQGINIVKRGKESKRWCRLEKTKYASNDTEVLKNRLLVTDEELRCVLGVGRKTAKAIAQEADAVVRVNGRKLNSLEKIIPNANCQFCDGCFSGKYPVDID